MTESHGYRNRQRQRLTSSPRITSTLIIWRLLVWCTNKRSQLTFNPCLSFQLHWINNWVKLRLPRWHSGKNTPANVGDEGLISLWEDPLETKMVTHSSILAWTIPWTEEPGGLQSLGSQRVRHNWATKQQQHSHSGQRGNTAASTRSGLPSCVTLERSLRLSGSLPPGSKDAAVATSQRCSEDRGNWLCPMSRGWVLPTPWTLHLVVREPHFIEPSRRSGSANLLLHS